MKIIRVFFLIIISFSAFSQVSYGCSCIGTDFIDKSNKGLRNYYKNKFKGAIFTGKVLSVETAEFDAGLSSPIAQKKLTVEVDKYWFGIEDREVTVNTGMNSGDCGVSANKDDKFFFIARYDKDQLWTDICDYSIYENFNEEKLTNRFTEILGKSKTFDKKNNQ
jgi:hypothetical protein